VVVKVLRTGLDRAGSEPQRVNRAGSISIIRRGRLLRDEY
jgi:hypothetical protein